MAGELETGERGGGAGGGAKGSLAAHLRGWQRHLLADDAASFWRRALRFMVVAKVSVVSVVAFTSMSLVDLLMAKDLEASRLPLRSFLGGYSSIVAQIILLRNTTLAVEALGLAADVAEDMEAKADPAVRELFQREVKTSERRTRGLAIYAILTQVGVFLTLAVDTGSYTLGAVSARAGAATWWVIMSYGVVCCHVCLYTLLTMELSLHQTCCVLYREISGRLKSQGGGARTVHNVYLHSRVNLSAGLLSRVFGHLLPHFHTVGLVLPMVSTAEVIQARGRADAFALAMVPLLFTFFVSQCVAGQRLEDSSVALGDAAYEGPWLGEAPDCRRMRLMAIQSTTRPVCFGVPRMVVLNHGSCERALRIWFQYLQIMLNSRQMGGL